MRAMIVTRPDRGSGDGNRMRTVHRPFLSTSSVTGPMVAAGPSGGVWYSTVTSTLWPAAAVPLTTSGTRMLS